MNTTISRIDELTKKQLVGVSKVAPVKRSTICEVGNHQQHLLSVSINACSCSASCGSNYSRNGQCSCLTSCGSNYSR